MPLFIEHWPVEKKMAHFVSKTGDTYTETPKKAQRNTANRTVLTFPFYILFLSPNLAWPFFLFAVCNHTYTTTSNIGQESDCFEH